MHSDRGSRSCPPTEPDVRGRYDVNLHDLVEDDQVGAVVQPHFCSPLGLDPDHPVGCPVTTLLLPLGRVNGPAT